MLAAIYGLQALIFLFRMRWDMIAWMICKSVSTAMTDETSLHPRYSSVLFLSPAVLVLEDG